MADGMLAGVRILDLTHVWAGPLGVRLLADLGADVVRVEAPWSRGPRQFPAMPIGGYMGGEPGDEPWNASAIFVKLMRNRRSFCVDLTQPDGQQAFLDLASVTDVVVENFSARAMPSLGLGYDVLRRHNPRLVYLSMPGFGAGGPFEERVAFGPTVEAMSGLSTVLGYGPDGPRNSALALPDPIAAVHAAAAVTHALRERERSGVGQHIDMALYESAVTYHGPWLIDEQLGRTPVGRGGGHPAIAPHGVYPCAGRDAWVFVACANQAQWVALSALLNAEVAGDVVSADWDLSRRRQHVASIDLALNTWTQERDKQDAAEELQQAGVSAGAVNTTPDMLADNQIRAREFFQTYEASGVPLPGNAIHSEAMDPQTWTPCPRLGEHNAAVLRDWLGLDDCAVEAVLSSGAMQDRPPA